MTTVNAAEIPIAAIHQVVADDLGGVKAGVIARATARDAQRAHPGATIALASSSPHTIAAALV